MSNLTFDGNYDYDCYWQLSFVQFSKICLNLFLISQLFFPFLYKQDLCFFLNINSLVYSSYSLGQFMLFKVFQKSVKIPKSIKNQNQFLNSLVMPKARTSICLSALSSSTQNQVLQLQQTAAFAIKYEAYCNFLEMIGRSEQKQISQFSQNMLQQYELLRKLDQQNGQSISSPNAHINNDDDSRSKGRIANSMFMLKIQNQRLRCRERLLQQKMECQKVLYRKRRQQGTSIQNQRKFKIQEIQLLKQEVNILESIVDKKNQFKDLQIKQKLIDLYIPKIKRVLNEYDLLESQKQLNNILLELQSQL